MLYVNPLVSQQALQRTVPESPERRREALQEFEHLLAFQLLREMRKTVPENQLFGKSFASDFYHEMMDDFLAGQLAKSGQLGVARAIADQLEFAGRVAQRDILGRLRPATESSKSATLPINTPARVTVGPRPAELLK